MGNGFVKYISSKSLGPEKIGQLRYNAAAKADKVMEVLATPNSVLTGSQATTGIFVGKGNLCRVFGTSGTSLIEFGATLPATIPTTTTQTAAMLSQAVQVFVATGDFIRTTAEVSRVEIYNE